MLRRPLRVCHVSVGLCTGGLERLLVDFAKFHDPARTEMHFVVLRDVGRPAQEIRELGCLVHEANDRNGRWRGILKLRQMFRELKPDVVHTHNTHPHLNATLAARLAGVPVVVNTRHGQRWGESLRTRYEFRFAAWFADALVGVSQDSARLTQSQDRVPARKVRCIWNGIDTERFAWHGPQPKPVAISVARLAREKDFPTLLRAVHRALPRVPELELRIVGDGPVRPGLERLAGELGLGSHVRFLGERADVPDLLADAGFFVTSTLTEGISLTLLEAAAVGLPILATNVGGNPEIVVDNVTGRLVPPADPDALAEALGAMCHRQDQWTTMGRLGRERVLEHFDVRRMVQEYEELYWSFQFPVASGQ